MHFSSEALESHAEAAEVEQQEEEEVLAEAGLKGITLLGALRVLKAKGIDTGPLDP